MDKICGYRSKNGVIYATEDECAYVDLKLDHDTLEEGIRKKMLSLTTYRMGSHLTEDTFSPSITELNEIVASCNMLLFYKGQLNKLHRELNPKRIGWFSKLITQIKE
jgi:hypothetical protein